MAKKLSASSARRHMDASGFSGPSQGPSKRDGSSSSLAGSGWFGGHGSSFGNRISGLRPTSSQHSG